MKHQELLNKLTIEEKAALLSGRTVWETRAIPRLGIPSLFLSDGPHGIRKQAGAGDHLGLNASLKATCFPTAATIANSWDEKLGEEIGAALGEEAAARQIHVLLGPGLNMKRSPLCGRNFEYFSEDPYLAGKMAAAYIRGIQSRGVSACPKHLAVNNQELRRMASNSVVDERTLREIYLTGFEIAIKEGNAKAVMSAYNQINGVYANENKKLLVDILRDEWGFDGIVVTDWGGSNDHVKGVECRSNLEMPAPGLDSARQVVKAVESGRLSMEQLDACVDDLLEAILSLAGEKTGTGAGSHGKPGQASGDEAGSRGKANQESGYSFDERGHHKLARRAAAESAVLLKNEGGILPILSGTKVAVIGDFAFEPRYQGAGSSMVNATKVETIAKMIAHYPLTVAGMARGYVRTGAEDEKLSEEAVLLAKQADVVLYFFGLDELSESEGMDRVHMRLPKNQIRLLERLAEANPKVVGILSAGSAVELSWENRLQALLHGYLGGQAGAGAMLDLLTGKATPCGKLNETYPVSYEDTPTYHYFPGKERNAEYREGLYIGYRYYDTAGVSVKYPFGYGLSYTRFSYSDLKVEEAGASFTLENTGKFDGAEVVQLYVSLPDSRIFRPAKELKGFRKVYLKAGEKQKITIPFDDKAFRYWNVVTGKWEVEGGTYQITVGGSSAQAELSGRLSVKGSGAPNPYEKEKLKAYYSGKVRQVSDAEFELLMGHKISHGGWGKALTENDAICQLYYAKSGLARLVYRILTRKKEQSEAKGKPDLNILFIYNMPFRGIAKMTNGAVSMEMVDGMVKAANGRFFAGMGQVIRGYFRNRKENRLYEERLRRKGAETGHGRKPGKGGTQDEGSKKMD